MVFSCDCFRFLVPFRPVSLLSVNIKTPQMLVEFIGRSDPSDFSEHLLSVLGSVDVSSEFHRNLLVKCPRTSSCRRRCIFTLRGWCSWHRCFLLVALKRESKQQIGKVTPYFYLCSVPCRLNWVQRQISDQWMSQKSTDYKAVTSYESHGADPLSSQITIRL